MGIELNYKFISEELIQWKNLKSVVKTRTCLENYLHL